MLSFRESRARVWMIAVAVSVCLVPARAATSTKKLRKAANARTHRRPVTHRSGSTALRRRYRSVRGSLSHARRGVRLTRLRRSSRYPYRRRTAYAVRHVATLRISPDRTDQIQEALIHAGDLQGQPTGRWDTQTREAMKQYQRANGFGSTGLPDAKSLMKMGLGPHPLPSDVDPMAQARPETLPLAPGSHAGQATNPSLSQQP